MFVCGVRNMQTCKMHSIRVVRFVQNVMQNEWNEKWSENNGKMKIHQSVIMLWMSIHSLLSAQSLFNAITPYFCLVIVSLCHSHSFASVINWRKIDFFFQHEMKIKPELTSNKLVNMRFAQIISLFVSLYRFDGRETFIWAILQFRSSCWQFQIMENDSFSHYLHSFSYNLFT